MESQNQILTVWGEFACFTRPELKVERFSYPVITPSSARGIFDAIYCKPNRDPTKAEFRWQVTKIEILKPPKYIALRRNEVKDKISVKKSWIEEKEIPEPIWADGTKDMLGSDMKGRTQRQTMALKNVKYCLHAVIRPFNGFVSNTKGLEAQFRRRASKGKCIYQPYFGCREFPAYFELVEPETPLEDPLPINIDYGLMLYDVFDLSNPGTCNDNASISVFRAKAENGVINVPDYESDDVFKGLGRFN